MANFSAQIESLANIDSSLFFCFTEEDVVKSYKTAVLLVCIAISAIIDTGCPEHKTIAEIQAHPGKYDNKDVTVVGIVRDSYGASIPGTGIGAGAYKIDDGTGSIWVIATDGAVPQKGAQIGVSGTVGSGINSKGRNYGLGLYEKERHYKKR
jgi:hypothetical protein